MFCETGPGRCTLTSARGGNAPYVSFLSGLTALRQVRVMVIVHIIILWTPANGTGRNVEPLPRVLSHLMERNIALFTRPHTTPSGGIRRTRYSAIQSNLLYRNDRTSMFYGPVLALGTNLYANGLRKLKSWKVRK